MDQDPNIQSSQASVVQPIAVAPPPLPQDVQNRSNSSAMMWDSLEFVLMFISMYILGTTIGLYLHYYVDKFLPPIGSTESSFGLLDWIFAFASGGYDGGFLPALAATTIVVFPIFAFLFIHTKLKLVKNPDLAYLKLRKGLIYNTLVVTFIFMLYKMIVLVYGALTGNFTINFLLHFIVTVGINALIFFYFLIDIRKIKHA